MRNIRSGRTARGPLLDGDERHHECRGRGEQGERERRAEAVVRGDREPVDEHHHGSGRRECAGQIEVPEPVTHVTRPEDAGRQREERHANRGVDEEDPRPAEVRREHAPEEDADRGAAAGRGAPDPEREVALATHGEGRHQEG